jgi:hypothetical protein
VTLGGRLRNTGFDRTGELATAASARDWSSLRPPVALIGEAAERRGTVEPDTPPSTTRWRPAPSASRPTSPCARRLRRPVGLGGCRRGSWSTSCAAGRGRASRWAGAARYSSGGVRPRRTFDSLPQPGSRGGKGRSTSRAELRHRRWAVASVAGGPGGRPRETTMTKQADFKRRVRSRMDRTGESYSTARNKLLATQPGTSQSPGSTTTTMAAALHVSNGNCTDLAGTGLVRRVLYWRDVIHEGPTRSTAIRSCGSRRSRRCRRPSEPPRRRALVTR